jgi:[CysO sulfur-carrier protein]-S-L-cysteine hydrolase
MESSRPPAADADACPVADAQRVGHAVADSVLRLRREDLDAIRSHCLAGYPLEACGLLEGTTVAGAPAVTDVVGFHPAENLAASSKLYTVAPRDHLRADRAAEDRGNQIVGVVHSHTHTEAYPSPTDVAQAPDPDWHYVIVSLRDDVPVLRSYRIRDGRIAEEPVDLLD